MKFCNRIAVSCGVKKIPDTDKFATAKSDNYDFSDRFGNKYAAFEIAKASGGNSCQSGYFDLQFFVIS